MNSEKLEQVWNEVCEQVKSYESINPSQSSALFSRLHPQAMSEDFLMITADNHFIKNWIELHYMSYIKQALLDLYHVPFTVVIEVDITETSPVTENTNTPVQETVSSSSFSATKTDTHATEEAISTTPFSGADEIYPTSSQPFSTTPYREEYSDLDLGEPLTNSASPITSHSSSSIINPTYTFENFVIGDSNRMAYSMAVAVAETPGKAHLNPLFIYGKSGLGKTHLLFAIQNYISETMPHLYTVYTEARTLLSEYVEASSAHDKEKTSYKNFKQRYEEADILLIDDVDFFQGKKQTLDIVFQIFNKMISQGRQVVLSADRAPKNIDIDERYQSRFNSGGMFDIQPPEIETKLSIVKSVIDQWQETEGSPNLIVPDDIQMFIAESSSSNIRELKSAVTAVIYRMMLFNQSDLSLDEVKKVLENHFSGGPSKRLTIDDIQKAVESFYKVSHADILSTKRSRNLTYPRQVAIYLCRQMLDLPFNDIGKKFNRDHSTAMHAVTMIEEKMKENRELREELETLKQVIRES